MQWRKFQVGPGTVANLAGTGRIRRNFAALTLTGLNWKLEQECGAGELRHKFTKKGVLISTTEHLFCLDRCGIDNAIIELDNLNCPS
jgi:hypothetical protein